MKTNTRQNKMFSGNCSALMLCKQGKGKGVKLKGQGNCSTLSWELLAPCAKFPSV